MKQVNELTDITANYQQHKTGRTISGFSFTFKQKQERKKLSPKKTSLTEKQLDLFANKLAYDSAFSLANLVRLVKAMKTLPKGLNNC